MTHRQNRRKVERIPLLPHVSGRSSPQNVDLIEISMSGARLQHAHAIRVGSTIDLQFEWNGESITVPAKLVRSTVEKSGASSVYVSGIHFEFHDEKPRAQIRKLIGFHVKKAIDRQIANAEGTTTYSSRLMKDAAAGNSLAIDRGTHGQDVDPALRAMRDQGYVRYVLTGGKWRRIETSDPGQPLDGFTIWRFEDDEQAELLCEDYRSASPEMRNLIRLCAELSLVVDDRIPAQRFTP